MFSVPQNTDMIEREEHFVTYQYTKQEAGEVPQHSDYLITIPYGIGDAIYIGLAAVDQLVIDNPDAVGKIDVLCNDVQAELFHYDPRIHHIIVAEKTLFPTQDKKTWGKVIFADRRTDELVTVLQEKHYKAVFPGNGAFGFLRKLYAPLMYPNPMDIVKDYLALRNHKNAPATRRVREIVSKTINGKANHIEPDADIPLYLASCHIENGHAIASYIKTVAHVDRLFVVAPDTASGVTRPPTELLAEGIGHALAEDTKLGVAILPSYSDTNASTHLFNALKSYTESAVLLPHHPKPSLLDVTGFIDQSDIFITGDTGIMHLAAAKKFVVSSFGKASKNASNNGKIIAIFGGTNPGLYGYSHRTEVIGRGRVDQGRLRPGLLKEGYNPDGKNFFDHITADVITQAILAA